MNEFNITVDTLNKKNDCFVRYLFSNLGNEKIVLNFVNAVMANLNFKTFETLEILNPFNLQKYLNSKESVVDIKCTSDTGEVVIIEIQLQGNSRFPERILYYWASNYNKLLKHGERYDALTPVISINLLNFNLDDNDSIHSCYMIYDTNNKRLLTDHLQIHILELKKFKYDLLQPDLNCWLKFFTMKEKNNKEEIMSELVKEKPIMEEVQKRYNNFIKDRLMMNEYDKRQAYLYGNQIMLEEERRLGREEGIKEGIKENQISMAKNMKKDNIDFNTISKYTGLSIEEIEKL